jgi:hypothetical protein
MCGGQNQREIGVKESDTYEINPSVGHFLHTDKRLLALILSDTTSLDSLRLLVVQNSLPINNACHHFDGVYWNIHFDVTPKKSYRSTADYITLPPMCKNKAWCVHHHWQNSPFGAPAFIEGICNISFSIHIFGLQDSNCSTEQSRQTCILEDQVPLFMSPSDRVAQLYPQAPGTLLSPSTTRRAAVGVF